ncbi:MAG: peptidase T [Pirellulaceae bacterium]|nr:peptidase T [Pirellulaceae bacterium]
MIESNQPIVHINRERLLERFLRYVRVGTAADASNTCYPSTSGQAELNRLLCDELIAMSVNDAHQDEHALVCATVPATNGGKGPTVALVAHVDTSPEAPGDNVDPQVIENYAGGDITLPAGNQIRVDATPALAELIGKTLITSDGTTLLGGDDKAGVAIIMELAHTLIENPHLSHGPVRVLFTCDEEIGRGTDKIDLQKLAATVAYTIDGGAAGMLDVETFSADAARVHFVGHNIHPAIAKDRMINAIRAAADFVAALPRENCTPETTEDREGFIHPYAITGGVGEATVELILRSFETEDLHQYATVIHDTADLIAERTPGLSVEVEVHGQYRNLREGLADLPEAITLAEQAFANLGRECKKTIVRGGTDGSQLTEKGLPTPNLSSGQHNIHSLGEFACLDEMAQAVEHLVELLRLWGEVRS